MNREGPLTFPVAIRSTGLAEIHFKSSSDRPRRCVLPGGVDPFLQVPRTREASDCIRTSAAVLTVIRVNGSLIHSTMCCMDARARSSCSHQPVVSKGRLWGHVMTRGRTGSVWPRYDRGALSAVVPKATTPFKTKGGPWTPECPRPAIVGSKNRPCRHRSCSFSEVTSSVCLSDGRQGRGMWNARSLMREKSTRRCTLRTRPWPCPEDRPPPLRQQARHPSR